MRRTVTPILQIIPVFNRRAVPAYWPDMLSAGSKKLGKPDLLVIMATVFIVIRVKR